MPIDAAKVAEILGGRRVLQRDVATLADLERVVIDGLPIGSLDETARYVAADRKAAAAIKDRLVPRATRSRRQRLKLAESERVARLARIMALAEFVWEGKEDARTFMSEPHALFGDQTPLALAETELGARRVEDLLMKLEYSLPA